jgi:diguanylate cyclase (GGDEF)-like protein
MGKATAEGWKIVLIVGSCLIVTYFVFPNVLNQDVTYSVLGAASVACILVGVKTHRPKERLGWYLIALAGTCFTVGDNIYDIYNFILHETVPYPSYADAFYLAGYPFLYAGVLRLTRQRATSSSREQGADGVIVSLGALAISWQFLMSSYVRDSTLTTFGMIVNLAYPMMDIGLIFIVFHALLFRQPRFVFHRLLSSAILVMFLGDFIYDLLVLHNNYVSGSFVDAFLLAEYVLIAAAALHPSMVEGTFRVEGTEVTSQRTETIYRSRLPYVLLAGFIPPAILVVTTSFRLSVDVLAISTISVAVFAAIGLRVLWMFQRVRSQSLKLEDGLARLEISFLHRNELEADLRHQALHDPLTGLANRLLFEDRLSQAYARTSRNGGIGAVMMLDLDDFKEINDSHGHLAGDKLLVEVARRLDAVTRPSDTLSRFGGDEFLYLTEGLTSEDEVRQISKRLLGEFDQTFIIDGINIEQRASVGIVICDSTSLGNTDCLRDADAAMYEAKRHHRGSCVFFTPDMHQRAMRSFSLTQELRHALRNGEISMHFQPIVNFATEEVDGFEALMRWRTSKGERIAPDVFLPVAERSDLIVELNLLALRQSIAAASSWARRGARGTSPFVTVNLSPRQLAQPDLVSIIEEMLLEKSLAPEKLVIELTEHTALRDIGKTMSIVEDLEHLGIELAIDDFGTGFSSLSHLTLLNPKIIKIDRSFVSPKHDDPRIGTLLETIVALGHNLDMTVLAEGIETQDQFHRIKELGCELGQGYFFSPAVPLPEVPGLIDRKLVKGPSDPAPLLRRARRGAYEP